MSMTFTGTGGLFTREAKILSQIRNINGFRGESAAVGNYNIGYNYYVDVATATTTGKATQVNLDGVSEPFTVLGIVQPDIPRNLVYNFTDGDVSISQVSITTVGVAPDGSAATETVTSTTDFTGSVIFAKVTSITLNSITGNGAADTLDIGHGSKFGVSTPYGSAGLTITLLEVDGTPESASATDTTYKSFTATTAANGTRDYAVTFTWTESIANWASTTGAKVKDADHAMDEIAAQFQSTLQHVLDTHYTQKQALIDSLRGAQDYLANLGSTTLIEQAHADAVLTEKTLSAAMTELIRQMTAAGDTVKANTVSASVAAASGNTGNATIVASIVSPTGTNREYVLPEVIELKITNDSQDASATAGAEPYSLKGEVPTSSRLDFDWPNGSGGSTSGQLIDAEVDGTGAESDSANMLINSHFDTYTVANTPDDWDTTGSTPGTDLVSEATVIYRTGGKSLEFLGTGGSPTNYITQTLNPHQDSGVNVLKPNTVYALNAYIRDSGAGAVAGAIEFALVNGSNTIITDDAGTSLAMTKTVATLTDSFVAYSVFFSLPKVLPTTIKLRIKATTALTNAQSIYIDDLCLVKAKEAYTGGPFIAAFRGSTEVIKNDQWNITIANNQGGLIQSGFDQMFDMRGLGLQLPSLSNGSHTIADTLVV